ncbi:MAG TPA: SDR family NAD(P)-dependent oxidoreductase, partial [Pseudonocardiaceae bacterium]|nr:SDR family NAD(P)-dependent oxidoreductase [Pseudonocardiaceae bacterium]
WLQGRLSAGTGAAGPPAPGSAEIGPAVEHGTAAANGQAAAQFAGRRPARLIQATVRSDVAVRPASLVTGAQFVVSGAPPVADALAGLLRGHGARVRTAADATATGDLDGVDGLILLDGLGPAGTAEPAAMFPTVKAALGRGEAVGGPRWLFAAGDRDGPRTAGLAGLFRTAHREYPHIDVRYIECEAGAVTAPEQLARRILGELLDGQGAPAVTYRDGIRHVFEVVPAELGAVAQAGAGPDGGGAAEARAIGLDRDSVVILVGGARGIGAWTARALAAAGGCRIELAGRTTLPATPESLDTAAATDLAGLRAVLARQAVGAPPEIDRRAREIVAVREVRATVAELTELGSQVRYHPVDVRDDDAVRQLVKTVHDEYGRVDGVVYAAGVVEDRLIAQKDPESFARVFTTKVAGAQSLLAALTDQGCAPRFVVLFGSVSAGFGTAGQVDYAAANDALDRIGTVWAAGTGHRCLTVHWGPWAPVGEHPGMVTPEIGRQYAKRGIAMIDPEEGALSLLRELAWGERSVTSVVYTATGPDAHAPAAGGVTEAS